MQWRTERIISTLHKAGGMTQTEFAVRLYITDKAVSKRERNVACPDMQTLPRLAELPGVSVAVLLCAKASHAASQKKQSALPGVICRAVPVAMGVAVTVTALLRQLDMRSGFIMPGIGVICISICILQGKEKQIVSTVRAAAFFCAPYAGEKKPPG